MRTCMLSAIFALAVLAPAAPGQPCDVLFPGPKLLEPGGRKENRFGNAVALDGDTALIGAPYSGAGFTGAGYLFHRAGDGAWVQTARLTGPGAVANDGVGFTVALRGDVAVLGAPSDRQFGLNAGAAYVYRRGPGGEWSFAAKLTAADPGPQEHFSDYGVATDGSSIIVASRDDDDYERQSGSAAIFELRDGAWVQTAQLHDTEPRADEYFGSAVSISGDTAVVGAIDDLAGEPVLLQSGSASVFRRVDGGWVFEQKLLASDRFDGQNFGVSVCIDGDTVVVGAEKDGVDPRYAGAVYVFRRGPSGTWSQIAKLTAPDGEYQDFLGGSVALDRRTAVAGAYAHADQGAAYVFREETPGGWSFSAKLRAADGERLDQFGRAVAVSGPVVLIGNWSDDDLGRSSGSAYVFAPCRADVECDGFIDFADYLAFLNLYDALDPAADLDGDGMVDIADYLRFLDLYAFGC